MAEASERRALIALSHVSFLTPREKLLLIDMMGGAREIFSLGITDMARLLGRRLVTKAWDPHELLQRADESEKALTRDGIGCIFYWDRAYPPRLREIYDPPVTLFYRGNLPENQSLIGIVGTRLPTGAARKGAFSLGFELGSRGIGVVSGLARGIDREAHLGCVEAGGYSVAVLGSGIDSIYPISSRAAAVGVLRNGGAIVSEYPPGTPPRRHHFPARNRIISGLCRGVVVIQAPERSGALITAEYALEQGRDLYVHRSGLMGAAGAGTRRLSESGAPIIDCAEDVLVDWGMAWKASGGPVQSDDSAARSTSETGAAIARLVGEEILGSCTRRSGQTLWRN